MKRLVRLMICGLFLTSALCDTIRQLTLFRHGRTSWNHAQELCQSAGMNLVSVNSPDVLTAMSFFKRGVWKGTFGPFWTGLHMYDVDKPRDFVWADCQPLITSGWAPWATIPDSTRLRCVNGKDDLNSHSNWDAKECESDEGKPVCEKYIESQTCPFEIFAGNAAELPTNLTRIMYTSSLEDCFTKCRDSGSTWECGAVRFLLGVCTLYSNDTLDKVVDKARDPSILPVHVKLCFTGNVNYTKFTYTHRTDNVPRSGCDGPAITTTTVQSPTEDAVAEISLWTNAKGRPTTTAKRQSVTTITNGQTPASIDQAGTTETTTTITLSSSAITVHPSQAETNGQLVAIDSKTKNTLGTTTTIGPQSATSDHPSKTDKTTATTSHSVTTTTASITTTAEQPSTAGTTGKDPLVTTNADPRTTEITTATDYLMVTNEELSSTSTTDGQRHVRFETTNEHQSTRDVTGTIGQTTSDQPSSSVTGSPTKSCVCPCRTTLTGLEKGEVIQDIIASLAINTRNVSATRRRYESASDPRLSSQTLGGVGVAVLTLVFGGLFVLDLTALARDLAGLWDTIRGNY